MNQSNESDDQEELDFSQYIPKWKNESEDDDNDDDFDWHFKTGFEKAIADPETLIDEKGEIKWKHIIKAAHLLKERNNNKEGPYSKDQVNEAVSEVMIQEALDILIDKNLIKKNKDGTFELTKLGDSIADELTNNDNKLSED